MFKKLKNNKGFTLVEVIVVAVIVAVLALVAIQLYQGYVKEARLGTANNLAASAASYLQTERNRGATVIAAQTITGTGTIAVTPAANSTAGAFTIPANVTLTITGDVTAGGKVQAQIGSVASDTSQHYDW